MMDRTRVDLGSSAGFCPERCGDSTAGNSGLRRLAVRVECSVPALKHFTRDLRTVVAIASRNKTAL